MKNPTNRKKFSKAIMSIEEVLWEIGDLEEEDLIEEEKSDLQKIEELTKSARDLLLSTLQSYTRRKKNH
jgi:hypothetical protein